MKRNRVWANISFNIDLAILCAGIYILWGMTALGWALLLIGAVSVFGAVSLAMRTGDGLV